MAPLRPGRALRAALPAALVAAAALAAPSSHADGVRLSASAGVGRAYDQTYYALGGRVGYDLGAGLTPELGLTLWGGATPGFVQLAPGLTWYVPLPTFRAYLGGFFAHDFVGSGFPDQDALGVRAGVGLAGAGPVGLSVGIAWARRLSCSADCDTWWPEAVAGVAF